MTRVANPSAERRRNLRSVHSVSSLMRLVRTNLFVNCYCCSLPCRHHLASTMYKRKHWSFVTLICCRPHEKASASFSTYINIVVFDVHDDVSLALPADPGYTTAVI